MPTPVSGIRLANQCSMLIATLDLWIDRREARTCRVLSYDTGSELEMRAHGQRIMLQTFDCAEDAVARGEQWRAALLDLEPQAA